MSKDKKIKNEKEKNKMGITLESVAVKKVNEGQSALYLSDTAHKNIEKAIETLKSFGMTLKGVDRLTKKACFEEASEVFLENVEKSVDAFIKAKSAAATEEATEEEVVA